MLKLSSQVEILLQEASYGIIPLFGGPRSGADLVCGRGEPASPDPLLL